MVSPVKTTNYVSEVEKLDKAINLHFPSSQANSSPKRKIIKLDPSITSKMETGSEIPSFESLKSKFQETLNISKFKTLPEADKEKAIKSLSNIQSKVQELLKTQKGSENTQEIDNLQTLNEDIQLILIRSKNEQDINEYFVKDPASKDLENSKKHIKLATNTGIFIRPSSDGVNYTLSFARNNKVSKLSLSLTDAGIFAKELNGEFPSLKSILETINVTPQIPAISPRKKNTTSQTHLSSSNTNLTSSASSKPIEDMYTRIRSKTNDYLSMAKVQFAFDMNAKYVREDEEFLVPVHNAPPNRFPDVPAVLKTIVSVEIRGKEGYLHANHVAMENFDSKFIVGQAPTHGHEHRFWLAVLNHGSDIVDLTTAGDDLTHNKGAYLVYPDTVGKEVKFAPMSVTLTEKKDINNQGMGYTKYTYQVKNEDTLKERTVTRYHYNQWIDHNAISPENLDHLVNAFSDKSKEQFVHCRAGIGRSGTFVVAAYLKEGIEKGTISKENFEEILEKLVLDGRAQRSRGFVEKSVQFVLLHKYGQMLLDKKA